jgi:hypothetical protein
MEDRYKMRAWNRRTGKYCYLTDSGFFEYEINQGEIIKVHFQTVIQAKADLDLCTGKRDKTGSLIYEKDLAKYDSGRIVEIGYHRKTGHLDSFYHECDGNLETKPPLKHEANPANWGMFLTVIGTVHDNKRG